MLYASTRATLKAEFGAASIKYDIQASIKVRNVYFMFHVKYKPTSSPTCPWRI